MTGIYNKATTEALVKLTDPAPAEQAPLKTDG